MRQEDKILWIGMIGFDEVAIGSSLICSLFGNTKRCIIYDALILPQEEPPSATKGLGDSDF